MDSPTYLKLLVVPHPPKTPNETDSSTFVSEEGVDVTRKRLIPLTIGDEIVQRSRKIKAITVSSSQSKHGPPAQESAAYTPVSLRQR